MNNIEQLMEEEDFVTILDFLKENCLATEDEVMDATDLDSDIIYEYFSIAQAVVAGEIEDGEIYDPEGVEIASGFFNSLKK